MIKRLWFVLCVLWTLFIIALYPKDPAGDPELVTALYWLGATPWIIGQVLPVVARWVLRGGSQE